MVRIRQIKPSFWEDSVIDLLPDAVKLFYVGTWQLADDGGYFEWNVPEIGRALYGFRPRSRRERWVRERGDALVQAKRLVLYDCGHAFVPNLAKHQKFGGRLVQTHTLAHARDCAPMRADVRHGKERVTVRNGKEKERVEEKNSSHDPLPNIRDPKLRALLLEKTGDAA